MFAVGHMSVAYLLTRGLKWGRWHSMSIPMVWMFSLLPDVDLLIPGVRHMGPTHSLFFIVLVSLVLILYKKMEAVPYFLSYFSHIVFGDLITNRSVVFLWPFSRRYVQILLPYSRSRMFSTILELVLFVLFLVVFILSGDASKGIYSRETKPLSIFFFVALLVPVVLNIPISVPSILIVPHIILMVLVLRPFYHPIWVTIHGIFRN